MSQIKKKFIQDNAIDENKIRLSNNAHIKSRNAADSGDINIVKVNASDRIEFASVPQSPSDASSGNDLVRYSQFQSALEGLKPKEAVRAASTADVDIATELEDGDTLDGITLATGDRVLLKDQSDATENGIYIVAASGAASRSSDLNASSEFPNAYVLVREGTANQAKGYVFTVQSNFALGTDDVTLVQFSSSGSIIGGDMITVSGSTVSVDLHAVSGLESSNPGNDAGELRIKLEASNPTIQIDGSNQLGVKFSGTTSGLEATASGLAVNLEASNPSLEVNGSGELKAKLDAAGTITSGASGLKVGVDDSTIEISSNALRLKDDGVTGAKLAPAVAGKGIAQDGSGNLDLDDEDEELTLNGTDITNQYKDASFEYMPESFQLFVVGGPIQRRGTDYTLSVEGGVTRITFAGDLATGGNAALISGDILVIQGFKA